MVWDPKLTTPPGLYFISLGFKAIGDVLPLSVQCSVQGLRATNLLFAFLLYFVLVAVSSRLHPHMHTRSRYYALSLTWFPVSFFYFFMYYTDTGSTLFVLLSYLGVLTERYFIAGLVSGWIK